MALEKRRAFALKKVSEAVDCFSQGRWATGLPKARAALELLGTATGLHPEDTSLLCGGVCLALASNHKIGEALDFFCKHAVEIGDERIKLQLLDLWQQDVNSPMPGDLVQFADPRGQQLVGVVVNLAEMGHWLVKVTGTAAGVSAAAGPGEAVFPHLESGNSEVVGHEIVVLEDDLTLLTLRLSAEQRNQWKTLLDEQPGLFGQRMRSDNEARWQRLFGAAARSRTSSGVAGVGAGACGAAEDLGLPLEQSFVATVYGLIVDYLDCMGTKASLTVDLLGCRPALELDDPDKTLVQLLSTLPAEIRQLTIRMCGPEVGCEARVISKTLEDGRLLSQSIQPGLYHDVFPEADADLVVALNAGIGVPQYTSMWTPTLDLLARRSQRGIFAITSYTSGELLREERLLRSNWACEFVLAETPILRDALHELLFEKAPWTLTQDIQISSSSGREETLRRGDVVWPADSREDPMGKLPDVVRIWKSADLVYVGPNPTPGRSRNYGKLLLRIGCEPLQA